MVKQIKKGDIVILNFNHSIGSEQGEIRPAVVLQNNISNKYSPTTIVAPLTSQFFKKNYPTNVFVSKEVSGLKKDSSILLNQIKTIDKSRIQKKICSLNYQTMMKIDLAIKVSLGLI